MIALKKVIKSTINKLGFEISKKEVDNVSTDIAYSLNELSLSQVSKLLDNIPYFEDKINLMNLYQLNPLNGRYHLKDEVGVTKDLNRILSTNNLFASRISELLVGIDMNINEATPDVIEKTQRFNKVHFACGGNYLADWLNVDFGIKDQDNYLRLNLCEQLPFPDEHFKFGFAEDFLEHLRQDDSIIFLAESYRSLQKGGVLRLSFPGLEGVLRKHYLFDQKLTTYTGKLDAYLYWDHLHFYSKDELSTVARHIGYSEVKFVDFGLSQYKELSGIDTREHQKDLNTYVELTK